MEFVYKLRTSFKVLNALMLTHTSFEVLTIPHFVFKFFILYQNRHHKDSKPLWPMPSGRPSKADIPPCKYCGGSLVFEFQVSTI